LTRVKFFQAPLYLSVAFYGASENNSFFNFTVT